MPDDICFLCNKQLEGEDIRFTLHEGFALFTAGKPGTSERPIVHSCKRPEFWVKRKQAMQASKLDKLLTHAILNPSSTKARDALAEFIYDMLLEIAKSGSTMDAVKASERLIELFVGAEATPTPAPVQTPEPEITVVVRERFPMADLRVGEPIAHDNGDVQHPAQRVDPGVQQSFETFQDRQQQNGVEDFGTVEDRRERERQAFWKLEVASWEEAHAAKRGRGLFG